jgi:hypothetical protein
MVVQPATGIWQVHDDVDMKTDDTDPTQPLDLTSRTMNGSGFESITEEVESRCSSISGASSIDVDESDGDDDDPSSSSGDTSTMPINEKNPRQCAKCGKIFQNHFSVKTHYQNVHLKLMHRCSVAGCSAAFPSKRSRDRHSGNEKLHRKLLSPSPPPATDNNNEYVVLSNPGSLIIVINFFAKLCFFIAVDRVSSLVVVAFQACYCCQDTTVISFFQCASINRRRRRQRSGRRAEAFEQQQRSDDDSRCRCCCTLICRLRHNFAICTTTCALHASNDQLECRRSVSTHATTIATAVY